jgi:hypothetical protein
MNISQTFNVPGVGQNKLPKWAKPACQTQNLAQDASPGLDLEGRPSPRRACPELAERGRLKIGRDAIMDKLQPSLRDSIMLHDIPRTSVLG